MASLRTLLNIETAADLAGAAGAVPGKQWVAQSTCYQCEFGSYHELCCYNFIVPASTSEIIFDVWGGGGGAGRSRCCGGGAPGGSGAWGRKTIKSSDFSTGDCYSVFIGRSTSCSQDNTGCLGCYSCVCSRANSTVRMCSQGGGYGCWYCQPTCCDVNSYCTCERNRPAYGGDINVVGHVGCGWYRCRDDSCYNKVGVPYPGGLHNKCGGVIWVNECCHYAYGAWITEYAGKHVIQAVGSGYCCNGYTPGLGGATQSTNRGVCRCGTPGAPGMVRVTYR
jgi:hypothetical protein